MRYILNILLFLSLFFTLFINSVKSQAYCGVGQYEYVLKDECIAADPNNGCSTTTYTVNWNCYKNAYDECVMNYQWVGCYSVWDDVNKIYECEPKFNSTTLPCGYASGGGSGGSYVYTKCPTGTSLSCGSTTEAAAQNKTDCLYKATCNKYFFPSLITFPAPCNENPVSAMCYSNCSCCPSGSYRTCTQGSQYDVTITIDFTNQSVEEREAAKVSCAQWHGHDDIFVSNTRTRNYYDRFGLFDFPPILSNI